MATLTDVPNYYDGRELAALKNGPYMGRWYWRDEFEAQQESARRHAEMSTAVTYRNPKIDYVPTEEWLVNPSSGPRDAKLVGVLGRAWVYQPKLRVAA